MANVYNASNLYSSSSSSPQREPDEISLFLQQILLRSSSSSSSFPPQQSFAAPFDHFTPENRDTVAVVASGRISAPEPPPRLKSSSYSSVGNLENEPDEYDYESEEAVEAVVEKTAPKTTPPRSSSKRSRAAEVHNLSEKRRRSRINEKMKALQNLIPNSNKTDKASMLDEAIEYLKQLQLQVQMLTMRNGLSLYPICLPGIMHPNQICQMTMDISESNKALNASMAKAITVDRTVSVDALLSLQDDCVKQATEADLSNMMGIKTSVELDSSIPGGHFEPFDHPQTSSTGRKYYQRAKAMTLSPLRTHSSNQKETHLQACLPGGDGEKPNVFIEDEYVSNSE